MRIEVPKEVERFGAIQFRGLQKVFELDSGLDMQQQSVKGSAIRQIPYGAMHDIQKQMAIVVPIKNERLKLIEGVLCGIPHPCLIIVVSNSPRHPVDRFRLEQDALKDFCMFTNKHALIIHQKDPVLAKAFSKEGYKKILGKGGRIRDGKAEGMIIGTMLAWLAGKKYVGFIDADNYFPGAVEEYIREYSAGFYLSGSEYTMVRIAWHSKPKVMESKLFFKKWGRTSKNTNKLLNQLISHYTGYETEIIKTGNAGEHALTMKLAKVIDYSAGFSIEPYHFISLLEKYGAITTRPLANGLRGYIEVYQIESRNPHLHEAGDDEHVDGMTFEAMLCIYHSPICPADLKSEILKDMKQRKFIKGNKVPPPPRIYPALSSINPKRFLKHLQSTPYGKLIKGKEL